MARTKMTSKMVKTLSSKHFTKAELKEREENELLLSSDFIVPSEFLPERLHGKFHKIVDEFKEYGILSNVDSDALSRYVMANEHYWSATKILNDMTVVDPEYPQIQNIQDKYFKQVNALAKELGLTMVSRSKLKKEDSKNEEKELSEEERMFGDIL